MLLLGENMSHFCITSLWENVKGNICHKDELRQQWVLEKTADGGFHGGCLSSLVASAKDSIEITKKTKVKSYFLNVHVVRCALEAWTMIISGAGGGAAKKLVPQLR